MFDRDLVLAILAQIHDALEKIQTRTAHINDASDFTDTASGMEKLDGVCMLFAAAGEALKQADKITSGKLFPQYPEIDWKGAMGFRDIIVHHYFDIDAEQVAWLCKEKVGPLSATIKRMIGDVKNSPPSALS